MRSANILLRRLSRSSKHASRPSKTICCGESMELLLLPSPHFSINTPHNKIPLYCILEQHKRLLHLSSLTWRPHRVQSYSPSAFRLRYIPHHLSLLRHHRERILAELRYEVTVMTSKPLSKSVHTTICVNSRSEPKIIWSRFRPGRSRG